MSCEEIRASVRMLFDGLDHCHSRGVMHRNLKPEHILVNAETMDLKLCDFGLARNYWFEGNYTHEVVSLPYRPPEILLGIKKYTAQVDIWSMGCIMAEMADTNILFLGDCEIDTLFAQFRFLGSPTFDVWPELEEMPDWKPVFPKWKVADLQEKALNRFPVLEGSGVDLLLACLRYNPGLVGSTEPLARPTARQCVAHDFCRH